MIIITGPGRTGTSVLARIYQELGFDPGGIWHDDVRAGLEARDVIEANEAIIDRLGMTHLGTPSGAKTRVRMTGRRFIPERMRPLIKARLANSSILSSAQPSLLRWERFDSVLEEMAPHLREVASRHEVVKDPRFCWTLAVWAGAGVSIPHVALTVRRLESMVRSRLEAQHLHYRSVGGAKNGFVYAVGLCAVALFDYEIPHSILRFPDFLESPERLFASLRFPGPVSEADFRDAFARVVRPELIHEDPDFSRTGA